MTKKDYNYLALRGAGIKDEEYVEKYNLDPEIANMGQRIRCVFVKSMNACQIEAQTQEPSSRTHHLTKKRLPKPYAQQGMR